MAFGPESTNPRERRAYAHAMLAKAKESGANEDFALAVSAVEGAGDSRKSRESRFVKTLVAQALRDDDTRTIVDKAREVLDPELTPRMPLTREPINGRYGAVARRFSPDYFSRRSLVQAKSGLGYLGVGRFEQIDADTGKIIYASELEIHGQGVIPTDSNYEVDVIGIRKLPDEIRASMAGAVTRATVLHPDPETLITPDDPPIYSNPNPYVSAV